MSKSMTQTQIKHIESRINSAIRVVVSTLRDKQKKPVYSTNDELIQFIESGKCKIKTDADLYSRLDSVIETPKNKTAELLTEANKAEIDQLQSKLNKEKGKIMDKVILGDSSEALQILEEFIANLPKP